MTPSPFFVAICLSPAPKTLTYYYYHQSQGRYYVTDEAEVRVVGPS